MKGIILAGGTGSRLFPITRGTSKQLLPVYDKPMVYYPLSVLMLAQIKDVLLITTPTDMPQYQRLLGDGSQFGIKIQYKIQEKPAGLAQAFLLGEDFIGSDNVALVLGDNIFYAPGFSQTLLNASQRESGATIFCTAVNNPTQFGIAQIDDNGDVISIEEKPEKPKSNYAITGLYFYDNDVVQIAKDVKPSARGELEISCVNRAYMEKKKLKLEFLGRGFTWLDSGTHDSLLESGTLIQALEKRHGYKIACLEEIGYTNGWLSKESLLKTAKSMKGTGYAEYLENLVK
ncbi:MAG: glucose-1-phosphate thymidylyltransferase RfbA [Bacteriovoracaceae bacterium]|nr:glucose-1-phosphate thymidylyltransferase RfbA [Bacteriovoracaceae bacterium]